MQCTVVYVANTIHPSSHIRFNDYPLLNGTRCLIVAETYSTRYARHTHLVTVDPQEACFVFVWLIYKWQWVYLYDRQVQQHWQRQVCKMLHLPGAKSDVFWETKYCPVDEMSTLASHTERLRVVNYWTGQQKQRHSAVHITNMGNAHPRYIFKVVMWVKIFLWRVDLFSE